ncbi:MAG TPA: TetR/AcrR family transcriptional regulator, partial [Micromonosporaceae bacterium]|nr:TetR/AcrR family transcriptional regulator [Micromonosporaceae bacterium]
MPRVSEAHLAARRQQILDAARRCFTRNGFHATSMQDVIAEAGLSVGAIYRYFRSKEELVIAIAEEVLAQVGAQLAEVTAADPPPPMEDALRLTIEFMEPQLDRDGLFQLAVQVWAESFRNQQLAEFVADAYRRMRASLVELAWRTRAAGDLPDDADPEAVGAVLFGLIPGYGLQRLLLGQPEPEAYLAGVRSLLSRSPRPAHLA